MTAAADVADGGSLSSFGGRGETVPYQTERGNLALIIRTFPDEDVQAVADAVSALGGVVHNVSRTRWRGTIRADLPDDQLVGAAHVLGVQWIEPAPIWQLTNNIAADVMNILEVWNTLGLRGEGQIVAVTDGGFDQGAMDAELLHDDFEDGAGGSRVVALYDLVGDGAGDTNSGHGTHVAGSVLGNGQRSGSDPLHHSYPSTAYAGAAPEARLVFQATEENATGFLTGIPADLNLLFTQTYTSGARVHSNSWGAALDGEYAGSAQNVDEFVWDHPEMVILFAAGNSGEDADGDGRVDATSLGSPAAAKNVITVGASENLRPSGSSPTPGLD